MLSKLTDPATADPDKSALVDGGLSPEQLGLLDQKLNELNQHAELPFNYDVTDIVPAINNLSGVTMHLTGPHVPNPINKPLVLVKQGDSWKLTGDSYDPTFIHVVKWIAWYNDEGGRWEGGGGTFMPPTNMPGALIPTLGI
ncbi:MAG TPA: hypothetical protein VF299_09345 [Mycobacterium sp.]